MDIIEPKLVVCGAPGTSQPLKISLLGITRAPIRVNPGAGLEFSWCLGLHEYENMGISWYFQK